MSSLCSVVCVSYNHAQYAADGLQSIYDQTYQNIEIIVLDDGSNDNSSEVIRQTLGQSPFPTKFIEQFNTGNVPENFNKAIAAAVGEFVTVMSLDDLLMPDCIANAVNILRQSTNIIFAANTGHFEIDEHGHRLTPDLQLPGWDRPIETAQDLLDREYEMLGAFYIQGQIFRRDAVLAVGCFDDSMTGDDIVLRTRLFKHMVQHPELTFSIGSDVVLAYRKHGGNLHKRAFRQLRIIIEWKEKYFPDRPYPDLLYRWMDGFFSQCVKRGLDEDLRHALAYSRVIRDHYTKYRKTWRYRRNVLKRQMMRFKRT